MRTRRAFASLQGSPQSRLREVGGRGWGGRHGSGDTCHTPGPSRDTVCECGDLRGRAGLPRAPDFSPVRQTSPLCASPRRAGRDRRPGGSYPWWPSRSATARYRFSDELLKYALKTESPRDRRTHPAPSDPQQVQPRQTPLRAQGAGPGSRVRHIKVQLNLNLTRATSNSGA